MGLQRVRHNWATEQQQQLEELCVLHSSYLYISPLSFRKCTGKPTFYSSSCWIHSPPIFPVEVENCICLPSSLPRLCPLCSPSSTGTFLVLLCHQVSHQGCFRAQNQALGSCFIVHFGSLENKKQEIMATYWAASKLSPFQGFSRITGQAHTQAERHEKQAVGMGEEELGKAWGWRSRGLEGWHLVVGIKQTACKPKLA